MSVRQATDAGELADKAQGKVTELERDYEAAIALLRQKEQDSGSARERAHRLLERASSLSLRANGQVEELRGETERVTAVAGGVWGSVTGWWGGWLSE